MSNSDRMRIFVLILVCLDFAKSDDDGENQTERNTHCRNRQRLVGDDKNDLFTVVEADVAKKVSLQCHFCNEADDKHPKVWYKLDRMDEHRKREVPLGMNSNSTLNRVRVTPDHTLIIQNLTADDAGEYFCRGPDGDEVQNKYNFYLDVVLGVVSEPEVGNLTFWESYRKEVLAPINNLLTDSEGANFKIRDYLRISMEVVTEWEEFGVCEVCGRPKGDGRRTKTGHCRIKVSPKENSTAIGKKYHEKLIMRSTHVSCRSLALKFLMPDIFNMTQAIPDFLEVEQCDGICNPDAEGVYKGWKSTKKSGFKFRKTFVLAEDAHLTLICPESTLENRVVWKINGHTIAAGESVVPDSKNVEPRVTVDSFNTLYLYGVTKDEEGNYTCYVDEMRMQQVRVFVVSKAKLLTQAFVRHMMYLAFVLSLTLSCYCAGLVVTWTRRRKFKSYHQLRRELKKANKLMDDEDPYDTADSGTSGHQSDPKSGTPGSQKSGTPGSQKPGSPDGQNSGTSGGQKSGTPSGQKSGTPGGRKSGASGGRKSGTSGSESGDSDKDPLMGSRKSSGKKTPWWKRLLKRTK